MQKFQCWWFGCTQEYDYYGCPEDKCSVCGKEIDYASCAGDTRHNKMKEYIFGNLKYYLFRKWFPEKCEYCGHRYKCDELIDHIPF